MTLPKRTGRGLSHQAKARVWICPDKQARLSNPRVWVACPGVAVRENRCSSAVLAVPNSGHHGDGPKHPPCVKTLCVGLRCHEQALRREAQQVISSASMPPSPWRLSQGAQERVDVQDGRDPHLLRDTLRLAVVADRPRTTYFRICCTSSSESACDAHRHQSPHCPRQLAFRHQRCFCSVVRPLVVRSVICWWRALHSLHSMAGSSAPLLEQLMLSPPREQCVHHTCCLARCLHAEYAELSMSLSLQSIHTRAHGCAVRALSLSQCNQIGCTKGSCWVVMVGDGRGLVVRRTLGHTSVCPSMRTVAPNSGVHLKPSKNPPPESCLSRGTPLAKAATKNAEYANNT